MIYNQEYFFIHDFDWYIESKELFQLLRIASKPRICNSLCWRPNSFVQIQSPRPPIESTPKSFTIFVFLPMELNSLPLIYFLHVIQSNHIIMYYSASENEKQAITTNILSIVSSKTHLTLRLTYTETLILSMQHSLPFILICTWNLHLRIL